MSARELSTRMAVLFALEAEQHNQKCGKPFSEAVVAACEAWLNVNSAPADRSHIELSQPKETT